MRPIAFRIPKGWDQAPCEVLGVGIVRSKRRRENGDRADRQKDRRPEHKTRLAEDPAANARAGGRLPDLGDLERGIDHYATRMRGSSQAFATSAASVRRT